VAAINDPNTHNLTPLVSVTMKRQTTMHEDLTRQKAEIPDGNSLSVIGVFDNDTQATAAEQALEKAGFSRDDISVVAEPADARPPEVNVGQRMIAGATKGALLGGLAAAMVAVPGVGLLLAAGPVAFILGAGGLVGSFVGLGLAREQAQRYEDMVQGGAEVVIVRAATDRRAEVATHILSQHGAHDILTK
jgi:hypothetical protein